MKTITINKYVLVLLISLLFTYITLSVSSCITPSKGYNYKAHNSKNIKFKKNNEHGKYMKCKRK